MRFKAVEQFVFNVFEHLHERQRRALASFVFATLFARVAGVAAIGRALAAHRHKLPKHAIKQFDRFLSNPKLVVGDVMDLWIRAVAGSGRLLLVIDWTEFAGDGHHVLMISRVHRSGRAIPMAWTTVLSKKLDGRMKDIERELLARVRRIVGPTRRPIVLADRAFGDVALYQWLRDRGFDFVIRFRKAIFVRGDDGIEGRAADLVPTNGRARRFKDADVAARGDGFATVVLVKRRGMKDSWCLATNLDALHADDVVRLYGRRFTTEETFRDVKDVRFGLGLSKCSIARTDRRDRMLLVVSIALFITSVVGCIAERLGLERHVRANKTKNKTRAHSIFSLGRHLLPALATRDPPAYLFELEQRIQVLTLSELAYAA